jgi:hypothetical protein
MVEDASTDPRLQAAELMSRRLASHPGATAATRRLAETLVSALRGVLEEAASDPTPLDDLDARAGDLLAALAALHGVIVRRDLTGAARALVEAERTLSDVRTLEDNMRSVEEMGDSERQNADRG